jgi:transcription-repair coupling factor (superfamily II helicase)
MEDRIMGRNVDTGYRLQEEPNTNLERLPFPELIKEFAEYYKKVSLVDESNQETIEQVAEKWYSQFGFYPDPKQGFIAGAEFQVEKMGLMEIELNNTKRLLASCEKALEDRDKKIEKMYSEEEVIEVLTQRCKEFGTKNEKFQKLLLKQDLEWFEQFKKK